MLMAGLMADTKRKLQELLSQKEGTTIARRQNIWTSAKGKTQEANNEAEI